LIDPFLNYRLSISRFHGRATRGPGFTIDHAMVGLKNGICHFWNMYGMVGDCRYHRTIRPLCMILENSKANINNSPWTISGSGIVAGGIRRVRPCKGWVCHLRHLGEAQLHIRFRKKHPQTAGRSPHVRRSYNNFSSNASSLFR
jgi:hypothetical protein